MQPTAPRERVRCRTIKEEDLGGVAELLCKGFNGYDCKVWQSRLSNLTDRASPDGVPRYGFCLDAGGKLTGVILLISSVRKVNGENAIFSNVASWYVEENYRGYAQLLVSMALRKKDVTYTNVTPAPHTWPIVENQGYTRYCNGLFFAAAAMRRPDPGIRIEPLNPDNRAHRDLAEYDMLCRHRDVGCEVLIVREGGRHCGYVFRRFRIRSGKVPLPAMMVIHGPDRAQLVRAAGNFGRYFMWRGAPGLVMDADGPIEGLRGIYTEARGRKYFRGPHRPAFCDLSDTELALFGV